MPVVLSRWRRGLRKPPGFESLRAASFKPWALPYKIPKKPLFALEQARATVVRRRQRWRFWQAGLDPERLVFTGTPNAGFGFSDAAREMRIGWRLDTAVPIHPGFEVNLDATRREAANGDEPPEHGIMLRSLIRW